MVNNQNLVEELNEQEIEAVAGGRVNNEGLTGPRGRVNNEGLTGPRG